MVPMRDTRSKAGKGREFDTASPVWVVGEPEGATGLVGRGEPEGATGLVGRGEPETGPETEGVCEIGVGEPEGAGESKGVVIGK